MLKFVHGNLLEAKADALVNTVNTEGVMGKGIALQFKQAFPEMYHAYAKACKAKQVQLGRMHVYENGELVGGPRWIINFPTKGHWKAKSRIEDVERGLQDLIVTVESLKIKSIAIPPLGCGNGGLNWNDVGPRMAATLAKLDADVYVYAPEGAPEAKAIINRTDKPNMTPGRAALIYLMDEYLKGLLDPFVSLLEVQKLMYFLQESGQDLRLNYVKGVYGPYADNLRHVLVHLEHHYISGYGDGGDQPGKPLELLVGAVDEASLFLTGSIRDRIHEVTTLIEGFEDSYGMELLSSVHWVMRDTFDARTKPSRGSESSTCLEPPKEEVLEGRASGEGLG